jgi:hypothetical protein
MDKFTTEDLRTLQSWPKYFKTVFQKIDKLNTTPKYWNSKGHMAVLKAHSYLIKDLIEDLGYYKKSFDDRLNTYSERNFNLSEIKKTRTTKPVVRKTKK